MSSNQYQSDAELASRQTRHRFDEGQQDNLANSFDDFDEQQRPWGFVAFLATALMLVSAIGQRAEPPHHQVVAAVTPLSDAGAATDGNGLRTVKQRILPNAEPEAHRQTMKSTIAGVSKARATRNDISFESISITTTEGAVAAVFVLERSGSPDGRVRVQWSARSGTADAAIDFSDASGTAVLADGQTRAAVYVPLRNDLLQEADETFKVCLDSPQQTGLGAPCAEATIRDDDELLSRR